MSQIGASPLERTVEREALARASTLRARRDDRDGIGVSGGAGAAGSGACAARVLTGRLRRTMAPSSAAWAVPTSSVKVDVTEGTFRRPDLIVKVGATCVDTTAVENFALGRRRVGMFSDKGSGGVHDAQLLAVLDGLPIAVMMRAADGSLLYANAATERFLARLGLDVSHVASSPTAMMDHIAVIDEHGDLHDRTRLPVVSAMRDGVDHEATQGYALPGGGWAWYATRAAPLALGDGTIGTVVTCDDVTPRRQLEEQLRLAALVDPLTGLANRRALETALDDAQRRRVRDGGHVGLLFLDLDVFKAVNDTLGHDAGDRVLVETGKRLLAATRAIDLVCRVGGDEFAVLCTWGIGREGLQELVARIWALPPVSMLVDGEPLAVRGSIGAVLVEPEDRLEDAMRRADAAMYRDKRSDLASLLVIG